ncbi:MAG TPA: 3-dehydroquinate synthase [Anaerolineaceae bacterium]
MHIFLYGPPGSGKTTLGSALAEALALPFHDLDTVIEERAGKSIAEIFSSAGEAQFRLQELEELHRLKGQSPSVVALGGGALVNPAARAAAEEMGMVICLSAREPVLLERLRMESGVRPLLAGDPADRLHRLLEDRSAHYASFALRLDTSTSDMDGLVRLAELLAGAFRVRGMGKDYDVRIQPGGIDHLGERMKERGLLGAVVVVSDDHVGAIYLNRAIDSLHTAGLAASGFTIPAGEEHKNIETVQSVWDYFIQARVERGSTIVALGGGVVGDLTGFAAATFLRGVAWVNIPTTLLSMVDSSLGGKTGIDLPQAKNLVGAFYPPRLVLADPRVLQTLPEREIRNGLAEVIKHGIISDPDLFDLCARGLAEVKADLDRVARQAMVVKLRVIEEDPYEKGVRAALNLGHTIGHGVELASNFRLSHGESVAIGTVAEARLAEHLGLAQKGFSDRIADVFAGCGLPVSIPDDLSVPEIVRSLQLDKKRSGGKVRFALPVRIGEVRTGVLVEDWASILFGVRISPGGA